LINQPVDAIAHCPTHQDIPAKMMVGAAEFAGARLELIWIPAIAIAHEAVTILRPAAAIVKRALLVRLD